MTLLNQISIEALGTHWWIELLEQPESELLRQQLLQTIHDFEQAYSRFLPNSLITQLNDTGVLVNPPRELVQLLEYGLSTYQLSGGAFDISIGSQLEEQGYGRQSHNIIGKHLPLDQALTISQQQISLSGARIDLGGFGKGWLIDKLAELCQEHGVADYLINGGGDIRVGNQPVAIAIEHPGDPSLYIGEIPLQYEALASSSPAKRRWNDGAKQRSHIQGRADNVMNENIASAHVLAPTATVADTLATLCFLMDTEPFAKIAQQLDAAYLCVCTDGTYQVSGRLQFSANR